MVTNIFLVGNPGVGKSYLLNSLGANFQSGFNTVDGLTEMTTWHDVMIDGETLRLIDAPGLLEAENENILHNAEQITMAFRFDGGYKLIFVVSDQEGRVNPADLYTMGKVMDSIDCSADVGLIINKVPDDMIDHYEEDGVKEAILKKCNSVAGDRIVTFFVIPRFKRNNPTGPRSIMAKVLKAMRPQEIQTVREITGSVQEFDRFLGFLRTVRTYVSGLWTRFQEWLKNF